MSALPKLISSKQVIADLNDEIGNQLGNNLPQVNRWINKALRKVVGRSHLEPRIEVLTFDGCRLALPAEAVLIQGIIWGDHGCECNSLFDSNFEFFRAKGGASYQIGDISGPVMKFSNYSQIVNSNGYLQFERDYDGQCVTIKMYCFPTDCGNILFPEDLIDPILAYLKYRMAERKMWEKPNQYTKMMYNEYKQLWGMRYLEAHGDGEEIEDNELDSIAKLLSNPLTGYPFPYSTNRMSGASGMYVINQ